MTKATKDMVLAGLSRMRGDDYERAKMAFRGLSPEQMQQQHGQSGETRQAILDGYRIHAEAVERAIAEVKAL